MTAPNRNLPARQEPAQSGQITLASDAAAMWTKGWSTFEKLNPKDREKVAQVIHSSFPEMGALEITKYFDMIGGKLRENAEFWMQTAAQHPATEWGPVLTEIEPGSDLWNEYVDKDLDHSIVACAFIAEVKRRDRTLPTREANYVLKKDAILSEFTYENLDNVKNQLEAQKLAKDLEAAGRGKLEKVGYQDEQQGGGRRWYAKFSVLREDFRALARKKCRTTAARRCCVRAFSLTEAKVMTCLKAAQAIIDRAVEGTTFAPIAPSLPVGNGHQVSGSRALMVPIQMDDPAPTTLPGVERPAVEVGSVESISDDAPSPEAESVDPSEFLSENDRRKVLAWAGERNLDGDTVERLKEIIASLRRCAVEKVSTKEIRYSELERIRETLESFPLKEFTQGDAFEVKQ